VSIIPLFNNILRLLKKNGTYQAMFMKYFSDALKNPEGMQGNRF